MLWDLLLVTRMLTFVVWDLLLEWITRILNQLVFFFWYLLNQLVGHQHRDPINSPDELKQEKKKDFGVVARDIKIKIIDMFVQINWYEFVFYSA